MRSQVPQLRQVSPVYTSHGPHICGLHTRQGPPAVVEGVKTASAPTARTARITSTIILFMVSLLSTGMLHPIPKQQRSAIPEGIPRDRVEEAPAGQQLSPRTLWYISFCEAALPVKHPR